MMKFLENRQKTLDNRQIMMKNSVKTEQIKITNANK